jgi:four helix bundle protein
VNERPNAAAERANAPTRQRDGRVDRALLERVEAFADRVLNVAEEIERQGRSRRIIDQLIGSGTSVGANLFEADEAMSTKDFVRCFSIALKELNETRFWLRLLLRRGWIPEPRMDDLSSEADQLRRILSTTIARSKRPKTT